MNGGMNAQREQLQYFLKALIQFNDKLGASMKELDQQHDQVAPHWHREEDDMRRHYDDQWVPLRDTMKHYLRVEGPGYVEFLSIKLRAAEGYLDG